MKNDEVLNTLNDLIETSRDGQKGFDACAKHAKAPELKSVFTTRASECERAAEELEAQVHAFGGRPSAVARPRAPCTAAGWPCAVSLTGFDDHAMLEECERGEDVALQHYRRALEKVLPPDVRSLVARQFEGVQRNHDQIRALRDRYPAAA